jgi:hypothetical protein
MLNLWKESIMASSPLPINQVAEIWESPEICVIPLEPHPRKDCILPASLFKDIHMNKKTPVKLTGVGNSQDF